MTKEEKKDLVVRILGIIQGFKEVYREDQIDSDGNVYAKKGDDKEEVDSCCNETINRIVEAVEKLLIE